MWVIAATMHMEGEARVWYNAYRLRQTVGDWSEFMDNVESHFAEQQYQFWVLLIRVFMFTQVRTSHPQQPPNARM
jgi:hypothetical protein